MNLIVENYDLIKNHLSDNKYVTTYHWIHNMFNYLIEKHNFDHIDTYLINENKSNLDKYLENKFGKKPKNIILFGKFELVSNFDLDNVSFNTILIIDDIHHSNRIKQIQKKAFNKSKIILSTYSYLFEKYFGLNYKYSSFLHASAYQTEYDENPIKKILIVGHLNKNIYPYRYLLGQIAKTNDNIVIVNPPKYLEETGNNNNCGVMFAKLVNSYICTFCDESIRNYLLGKFFEIPSYGSLLLAFNNNTKNEMKQHGFIEDVNYISCNEINLMEKINFILDEQNINCINQIRYNGYMFANKEHTFINRAQQLVKIIENI